MNKINTLCIASLCVLVSAGACEAANGYEMLFNSTISKLSQQEKQQIFTKLGFQLSKDKKFIIDDTCGEDVSPVVEVVDLNGDGVEEIFVKWGNTCTSGMTGQSVTLFVKDLSGRYAEDLGFPGGYEKLPTKNKGFPDLLISGPGFCHGVWQWTGVKYEFKCGQEEQPGACAQKDVDKICK